MNNIELKNMKIIKNLRLKYAFLAIVVAALSGCGTMGATNVLAIPVQEDTHLQAHLEIGSLELAEGATRVDSVAVFGWGEFSKEDLQNINVSLQNTLTSLNKTLPSAAPARKLALHVVVRRYLVTASNNAGAALANVAWCVVDEKGRIIFHEQFYASSMTAVFGTLGGIKDAVNEAVLTRIATMSAYLGSDMRMNSVPAMPHNAFLNFDQAAAQLPRSFRSVHNMMGSGYYYVFDIGRAANWNWASRQDLINWEERLQQKSFPQTKW